MSVRFDAASDRISYSATAPPATFTITCWVYLSVDRNDFSAWCRVWTAAFGTVGVWETSTDGTSGPNWFTGSGSISQTTNFVVGEWRRVAITRTSDGAGVAFAATATGPTEVDSATVSTATPAGITFGGRDTGDAGEWWNGRVAYARMWSSVLTQSQIEAEWASTTPVVTSGLWADWPLTVHTDLTDHSGNGRNLAAGTTATTTEADPPIAAVNTGVVAATLPVPTAALPATVTNTGAVAATLPPPAAALTATATDTGALAATIPTPTAEVSATVSQTGALAAALPAPQAALTGTVTASADLTGTLPVPVAELAATVTNPGVLAASLPVPLAALAADGGATTGQLAATIPPPAADLAANVSTTGQVAVSLAAPTAALFGSVTIPGFLAATLPAPTARLTTTPAITGPLHAGPVTDLELVAAAVVDRPTLSAQLV